GGRLRSHIGVGDVGALHPARVGTRRNCFRRRAVAASRSRYTVGEQRAHRLKALEKAATSPNPTLRATASTLSRGFDSSASTTSHNTPSRTVRKLVRSSSKRRCIV